MEIKTNCKFWTVCYIIMELRKFMNKLYKNVVRSQEALQKALLALLVEGHPLDKISVSELCIKADVNRGTFYNHYSSIDDVLSSLENSFMDSLSLTLSKTDLASNEGRESFFKRLGEFLEVNKKDALAISHYLPTRTFLDIKNKLNNTLATSFKRMVGSIKADDNTLNKVRFFVSGLTGSYVDAIIDGDKSLVEVSQQIYKYSNEFFAKEICEAN